MKKLFIVGLVLLAGCAGKGGPAPAPKRLQAIEANNHAGQLFARGDYAGAAKLYQRALEIERSVENEDGIAANLINLSIAYQRLGELKSAEAAVAEILDGGVNAFPPARI